MPNFENYLKHTEEKWLKPLFQNCTENFASIHLPSHDQWHHLRVWKNAIKLLRFLNDNGIEITTTDCEQLIIASFFHDQGMSKSMDKVHGQISKEICINYFNGFKEKPFEFDTILDAIEEHDKKDYESIQHQELSVVFSKETRLQKLLNIADDLDAYGIIGAYRYAEIYLLRNISPMDISEQVITNLQNRFNYFVDIIGTNNPLYRKELQQFMATRNFYKDLAFQLRQIEYSSAIHIGPIGVINAIQNDIIGNKMSLKNVCDKIIHSDNDFYCRHFFERLKNGI